MMIYDQDMIRQETEFQGHGETHSSVMRDTAVTDYKQHSIGNYIIVLKHKVYIDKEMSIVIFCILSAHSHSCSLGTIFIKIANSLAGIELT